MPRGLRLRRPTRRRPPGATPLRRRRPLSPSSPSPSVWLAIQWGVRWRTASLMTSMRRPRQPSPHPRNLTWFNGGSGSHNLHRREMAVGACRSIRGSAQGCLPVIAVASPPQTRMAGARSFREGQQAALLGQHLGGLQNVVLRNASRQISMASASIASPPRIGWQPAGCPSVVCAVRVFDKLCATASTAVRGLEMLEHCRHHGWPATTTYRSCQ